MEMKSKPTVKLSGEDGNAFNILSLCRRAGRKAGWTQQQIEQVLDKMQEGDYDHLLQTAMRFFTVT